MAGSDGREDDGARLIGARVPRIEDERLLRGRGRFLADLVRPGLLHARFVRSPVAHARLKRVELAAARAMPGVRTALAYPEIAPHLALPRLPVGMPGKAIRHTADPPVLAIDELCHVGEAVAVVVAETPQQAEDAAEAVQLEIEELPAVLDIEQALAPQAPRARLDLPDNRVAAFEMAYGDIAAAFAGAPHRFADRFHLRKGGGHSMETRGVLAEPDREGDGLVVWSSTQMPHRARSVIAATLGLGEAELRVVAPDVGGGFGPKFVTYPEEVVVALLARLLEAPVRWIEDRIESFTASTQERDQIWEVEVAADAEGRLLGLRGTLLHDHGAHTPYGIALPQNGATNLLGPYVLPAYALSASVVLTNKVPTTPTRGAGRPQGTFVMERMLDRIADALALPRAEVRRRNLIPAEAMPYRTPLVTRDGNAMVYDSGDYPACLEQALTEARRLGFGSGEPSPGCRLGVGLSCYVEGTGRGPFETASIRVGPSGQVVLETGAAAQGQGTATTLAQVCAEVLGVPIGRIHVRAGDTDATSLGLGAFASRQAPVAGSAVLLAARTVRKKALRVAGSLMEVAPEDLEIVQGAIRIRGIPQDRMTLGEVARSLSGMPGYPLPAGEAPGLEAQNAFEPPAIAYSNGVHVAEVEVDPATAAVRVLRMLVVHDCGTAINPTLVEGQVLGGVVHGIGMTLQEEAMFDAAGQPMNAAYPSYVLPGAWDAPRVTVLHRESPSPLNPLGAKGAGEGGTIAAPAAIISAVEDALRPIAPGLRVTELPLTPARLGALLEAAEAAP